MSGAPKTFAELPEETREIIANLPPEKFRSIVRAADAFEKAETIGRFMKWLFISIIAAFIGAVSLGESIQKLLGWAKPS